MAPHFANRQQHKKSRACHCHQQRLVEDAPRGPKTSQRRIGQVFWPRKFICGQKFHPESFNRSLIDEWKDAWKDADQGAENAAEDASEQPPEDLDNYEVNNEDGTFHHRVEPLREEGSSIARAFMRDRRHVGPAELLGAHRDVESFCPHVSFHQLQEPNFGTLQDSEPLAVFEECSYTGLHRKRRGKMNCRQLYRALLDERFVVGNSKETSAGDKVQEPLHVPPDADQRRLFILNVTPFAAAAVMATASRHEAPMIREVLHLHLNGIAEARVRIPPRGFQTFTFVVSIPFYRVKTTACQLSDGRRWPNEDLLREIVSLPVLSRPGNANEVPEEVQEAQTTIALTGIDVRRWTAICLADASQIPRSFAEYGLEPLPDGIQSEDLIAGKQLGDGNGAFDPRLYFLWAWEARIDEALTEWIRVLAYVKGIVKTMRHFDTSILAPKKAHLHQRSQILRDSVLRKSQLACTLILLKPRLVEIVEAWRQFQSHDVNYFRWDGYAEAEEEREVSGRINDALQVVEGVYASLQTRLKELEGLITDLQDNYLTNALAAESYCEMQQLSTKSNSLTTQNMEVSRKIRALAETTLDLARSQENTGKVLRRLTIASMSLFPLMLSFAFFSMSETALPFEPNFRALVLSLATFMAMTLVLAKFPDEIWKVLRVAPKVGYDFWYAVHEFLVSRYPFGQQRQQGTDIEITSSGAPRVEMHRTVEEGVGPSFVWQLGSNSPDARTGGATGYPLRDLETTQ